MQCVILAAGRGTRMGPLTEETPKPLVSVLGKPLLDHIVERLPEEIDEIVLVVGYKGEMIREHCGEEYFGRRVTYCEQENYTAGTGDALLCAKDVLRGSFLFLYGDDILGAAALTKLITHKYAVSAYYLENVGRFGPVVPNKDGTMQKILLGVHNEAQSSGLAYIGGVLLDTNIFDTVTAKNRDKEALIIDMLNAFAGEHSVRIVEQDLWIPIGFPEDVEKAEALLKEA